jgi:hypothetical protein
MASLWPAHAVFRATVAHWRIKSRLRAPVGTSVNGTVVGEPRRPVTDVQQGVCLSGGAVRGLRALPRGSFAAESSMEGGARRVVHAIGAPREKRVSKAKRCSA